MKRRFIPCLIIGLFIALFPRQVTAQEVRVSLDDLPREMSPNSLIRLSLKAGLSSINIDGATAPFNGSSEDFDFELTGKLTPRIDVEAELFFGAKRQGLSAVLGLTLIRVNVEENHDALGLVSADFWKRGVFAGLRHQFIIGNNMAPFIGATLRVDDVGTNSFGYSWNNEDLVVGFQTTGFDAPLELSVGLHYKKCTIELKKQLRRSIIYDGQFSYAFESSVALLAGWRF